MDTNHKEATYVSELVDGSIVTFQCIEEIPNDIVSTLLLKFEYSLSEGLGYIEKINSVTVSYSTDSGNTYNDLNYDVCSFYMNTLYLILDKPISKSVDYDYILLKIDFKVLVKNINSLSSTLGKGSFLGYYYHPMLINDIEDENVAFDDFPVEKYNFMVAGHSLNIDYNSKQSQKTFFASFSFNALASNYGNDKLIDTAEYIITIKPTNGIKFPTTEEELKKIKASIASSCSCHGPLIEDIYPSIKDGDLIIKIPHKAIYEIDNNCLINNNDILVSIPYEIYDCTLSPFFIQGSISLMDTSQGKNLASLDNFCLYVNVNNSNIIATGENVLC